MKSRRKRMIRNKLPTLGPNPDFSKFIYPDPPSHDFCVALVMADLGRRWHKSPIEKLTPLKVKLALLRSQLGRLDFGPFSLSSTKHVLLPPRPGYFQEMYTGVIKPAIEMIGAVEEPSVELTDPNILDSIQDYVEYDYHIRTLIDAIREDPGVIPPHFKPPKWAKEEVESFIQEAKLTRPLVVITLREMDYQPERNS